MHVGVVLAEDVDDFGLHLALGGDFIPERHGGVFHLRPFFVRNGGQLQLGAMDAQLGLAAPVPPLAVVVRLITADAEERLQILGQCVPAIHIGEERTGPGARDVVGQKVVGDVRPTHRVILGDAGPGDAVQLAGLYGDFNVFPRQGHRNHAELRQEAPGGGEGEHPFAFQVG